MRECWWFLIPDGSLVLLFHKNDGKVNSPPVNYGNSVENKCLTNKWIINTCYLCEILAHCVSAVRCWPNSLVFSWFYGAVWKELGASTGRAGYI